ncbi:MAG: ExbD/TolR family protein [Nevskiaceae bacterium]
MRPARHTEDLSGYTGIDLAPMLDFVLNLLIFFIITTSFIKEAGTQVTRPEAETAEYNRNGNILIAIRPNGDIWLDRKQVELRDVRAIIERFHIERPEDTVVIIADKDSQTGLLTQVMDQVRLAGVQTVSIAAAPSS